MFDFSHIYDLSFAEWMFILLLCYFISFGSEFFTRLIISYMSRVREKIHKDDECHGFWIPVEADGYDSDGNLVWDYWECSVCRHEHAGDCDTLTSFCPDCGSKLRISENEEEAGD